ncbi:uncharacterized protein EI90DRAFT_2907160 [Cantharellus anzutake]|uniref:uncharacterized protein n=1 Tax=Cantharellus anzutake TaxID=1750568 RepID=UPI0019039CB0|nr:uncharacterized protein EI90DRAFT_2907160 [Cantharellus anzutake]KAF8339970.1 hypothetical protein EI90DRAFT_2907160 [Cantharellus anzutake]
MLDSHNYLAQRGWKGKGTGLRPGGISKPITVVQKKTLAGVGKDRDEAFPFWEHVFDASMKSVNIRIPSDTDSDSEAEGKKDTRSAAPVFQRTSTGIISNRRPINGASVPTSTSSSVNLSAIAAAKHESARRQLYSLFVRGPVIGATDPSSTFPSKSEISGVDICPPTSQHLSLTLAADDNRTTLKNSPTPREWTHSTNPPLSPGAAPITHIDRPPSENTEDFCRGAEKRAKKERRKFEKKKLRKKVPQVPD